MYEIINFPKNEPNNLKDFCPMYYKNSRGRNVSNLLVHFLENWWFHKSILTQSDLYHHHSTLGTTDQVVHWNLFDLSLSSHNKVDSLWRKVWNLEGPVSIEDNWRKMVLLLSWSKVRVAHCIYRRRRFCFFLAASICMTCNLILQPISTKWRIIINWRD